MMAPDKASECVALIRQGVQTGQFNVNAVDIPGSASKAFLAVEEAFGALEKALEALESQLKARGK